MRRILISLIVVLAFTASVFAASVTRKTNTSVYPAVVTVTFKESTLQGDVEFVFQKCMANKLFTFYNVSLNGKLVNSSQYSDNIGPFATPNGWMGGNHDYNGAASARTDSYNVYIDGELVRRDVTNRPCDVMTIEVVNSLYTTSNVLFATEYMTYIVSGNTIEVKARHEFKMNSLVNIYYGMQSMMIAETQILTPGSKFKTWSPAASGRQEINVPKKGSENFCTFIEKSTNGYQAAYMTREGIGDRSLVKDDDWVFLDYCYGGTDGKCYHKIIGNHNVKAGDVTEWHGYYTWFNAPTIDNCKNASQTLDFEYIGYINCDETKFHLNPDGTMTLMSTTGINDITSDIKAPIATVGDGSITISETAPDARCFDLTGRMIHSGAGTFACNPGIYIVSDMKGHSVKLYVK